MSSVAEAVLLWTIIPFYTLLWTPGAAYVLALYYGNRNNQAIRRRHYVIVLIMGIIFIYTFFVDRPLALIDDANFFMTNISWLHTIHYISFPIQVHGIKLALVWRYFAIYFDLNFAHAMSDSKWKSIINTNNDQNHWFLKHKKTYGNFSWQVRRYLAMWFMLSIVSTIVRNIYQFNVYSESIASILHGAIIFAYAPILIYLYFKMPQINNIFCIRLEIKYITIIFISQFIVYGLSILCAQFLHLNHFMLQYIWSVSGVIAASFYLYFFTIWTLVKCVWKVNEESPSPHEIYLQTVSSLSYASNHSSNGSLMSLRSMPRLSLHKNGERNSLTMEHKPIEIDLYETLKNNIGYQYFMTHLMHEISHECLLSFTEMVEWKIAMKEILAGDLYVHGLSVRAGNGKTIKDILLFDFPEVVPISSIVDDKLDELEGNGTDINTEFKQKVIEEFKKKAYALFIKYIYDPSKTCEYEINVSYAMRDPLIGKLKNYNDWMASLINERELFVLFDECIIEMYDLMNDSFIRFKKSPAFIQLHQHINHIS